MNSELDAVFAVVTAGLLIGLGVHLGARVLNRMVWTREIALMPGPVPDSWAATVRANFPISTHLPEPLFDRLLKLCQVFLRDKRVEGAGGLEVDEEIRVTIAAQACFLVLWNRVALYPGLRSVIVYPDTFVPKRPNQLGDAEGPVPLLGESWQNGIVVLSWNSVLRGARDPRDGSNVVMHEFAHQLDQADGSSDGMPAGLPFSAVKPWASVIDRRYRYLVKSAERRKKAVLDHYGATNRAEFFAVATETFFEKPHALKREMSDLFDLLCDFYEVDPTSGSLERVEPRWPAT